MLYHNPSIDRIIPAVHGGLNYTELETLDISPEAVLDFSVSTNPFEPPSGIDDILNHVIIDRYPDSESSEFRRTLAKKLGLKPENLIAGSGSTELIRLVAAAYFAPGDTIIIPAPTYGDYEVACCLSGARIVKLLLNEEANFSFNAAEAVDLISKHKAKCIFLCNPNNPTGWYIPVAELYMISSALPDCLMVLDEAYVSFTANAESSLDLLEAGNVIVLRSMTKDYGLAGLRLGYAAASQSIISILNRIKPPWNVSSVAQAAGAYALKCSDYLDGCRAGIREAKEFLMNGLSGLGFSILPSQSNFFLVKVKNATVIRQMLLRKGIMVRDCTSFGLPRYIRLAPRSLADCRKLLSVISDQEVLKYGV